MDAVLFRSLFLLASIACAAPTAGQHPVSAAHIQSADPQQLYVVHLEFEAPVTVGAMRTVAADLNIPRVLAFVDYGPVFGDQKRSYVIVGLGRMYDTEKAREHSQCRALTLVNSGQSNELREQPIDAWPISKVNVYANAHIVRELLAGIMLPAALLIDASTVKSGGLKKVADYTRSEVAEPISPQRNIKLPNYCLKFLAPLDSPVLTGGFPPGFQYPDAVEGQDLKEYAFRVLAALPSTDAVTIHVKFTLDADIDYLASLVRQYDIRGMRAELVPESSNKRVIALAELSTFGAEPNAQIHRVRCQTRLGNEQPQASSEWYADWVQVSLSIENAVRFLSHPNLTNVRVTGSYPTTDLARLQAYFDRLAKRIYDMPRSIEISEGCDDVYRYNGQQPVDGQQPKAASDGAKLF